MNFEEILKTKSVSNHYLKRYIKFMNYLISRTERDGVFKFKTKQSHVYLENHHICPKAKDLFPEYECLSRNSWNKITLFPREHFIAHWILWKLFGGSQMRAFKLMGFSGNNPKLSKTSKIYESLRKDISENLKGDNNPSKRPEVREKLTGRKQTDYQKQRSSEANTGKIVFKETRLKISKRSRNSITVYFTDGSIKFFTHRADLGLYLGKSRAQGSKLAKQENSHLWKLNNIENIVSDKPRVYRKQYIQKIKPISWYDKKLFDMLYKICKVNDNKHCSGRVWVVKDGIQLRIKPEELQDKLNDGWIKGRK